MPSGVCAWCHSAAKDLIEVDEDDDPICDRCYFEWHDREEERLDVDAPRCPYCRERWDHEPSCTIAAQIAADYADRETGFPASWEKPLPS